MNIKDFSVLGFFEPGIFHLRVNTDEDIIDLNDFAKKPETRRYFSTFFHEYIHFLQEVTTTSGLITSGLFIDLLKDIIWPIRQDGQPTFKVPVEVSNKNNSIANEQLQRIYRGTSVTATYAKYVGFKFDTVKVADRDGRERAVRKYIVSYYDENQRLHHFHFGSVCLKEFVTHTLQQKHMPSVTHVDIPYQIAGLIAEVEYPPLATNPLFIVALCDASLMSLHPAETFFNCLQWLKDDKFIPNNAKDIYDFVFAKTKFADDRQEFTIEDVLLQIKSYTLSQLQDALQSDIFKLNYAWLEHVINEGVRLRTAHPHFITELVDGEDKLSPLFYEIFRALGTPFFTNNRSEGRYIPPAKLELPPDQPYQLMVFREILKTFFGSTACSMHQFCAGRGDKNITNDHCLKAPWLRATEDELCPFGQLWKTWGLIGELPV